MLPFRRKKFFCTDNSIQLNKFSHDTCLINLKAMTCGDFKNIFYFEAFPQMARQLQRKTVFSKEPLKKGSILPKTKSR